jgi:hypothetical protein
LTGFHKGQVNWINLLGAGGIFFTMNPVRDMGAEGVRSSIIENLESLGDKLRVEK